MVWLSKLLNTAIWPARAALTVAYTSRPFKFISGALITALGFAAIKKLVPRPDPDSVDPPSHGTPQEGPPIPSEPVGPKESPTSEQPSTWAWVSALFGRLSALIGRVVNVVVVKPVKSVVGQVKEKWDCAVAYVYVRVGDIVPQLSLHNILISIYCVVGTGLGINIIFMNIRDSSFVNWLWRRIPGSTPGPPPEPSPPSEETVDPAVEEFITAHYPGCQYNMLCELGSRMKKDWVELITKTDAAHGGEEEEQHWLLTCAPVSQNCPLVLHDHQKGLNKLLAAIKEHPLVHPIKEVYYSATHEKLIIVQPHRKDGSLKDLIYKVGNPTLDWSRKYARRSRGLPPETVARYGRHILEAMMFLGDLGLPPIDHVQSGNIFVVDDVCLLGGYENTLLGYKTRICRLCKDYLSYLDVILFGHLIFEMSAGYELTTVRPGREDYKAVHSDVRQILEFIFADGFPHSIKDICKHDFFQDASYLPPELNKFNSSAVQAQLSDSAKTVLEKVRKNKPRVQKAPSAIVVGAKALFSRLHPRLPRFPWARRDHESADQVSISSKHREITT